ncbi:hypothetical protein AAFN90_01225 [Erwiniaceae bacterium CAU 1747]
MKERPILFSDQRVRALLSGRQSQTRRIMKCQPLGSVQDNHEGCYGIDVKRNHLQGNRVMGMENISHLSPHGQPGDRLWVRETWRGPIIVPEDVLRYQQDPAAFRNHQYCRYRADISACGSDEGFDHPGWQAGIHMPRWASRIDLLITRLRIEKIQDISDDDIMAEGVQFDSHFLNSFFTLQNETVSPKQAYRQAWTAQYGDTSWEVNPWVWVIDFERI